MKNVILLLGIILIAAACNQETAVKEKKKVQTFQMTTDIPAGIQTPDKVETSIGTLEFF